MGATKRQQTASAKVWALVRRQHGVITRRQLVSLGLTSKAIKHRLGNGRLRPVARGVYAVGRPELTREGHWMTAVLTCGDGAVLSHSSAAALWGIGREWGRGIEVSVRSSSHLKRPGLVVHRRSRLRAGDVSVHHGIPVTSPAMTVLDHGARLGHGALVRMINDADKLGLAKVPTLRAFLDAHPRQEGVARLKELMDRPTFRATETKLEDWFLPIAEAAGLPIPLTQLKINGFKVDFFWPELGLVVEADGLTYHRTPAEQAADRLRDQTHTATGLTPLRFTHDQVKYEAPHVRRVLAETACRLAPPAADRVPTSAAPGEGEPAPRARS
jgi:very-short-patch-repair endonuclease